MKKDINIIEQIKRVPCAVIGLGVSNLPLIDFLISRGAKEIVAYDKKSEAELGDTAAELKKKGVRLVLGEGYLDNVCEKVIFRSPGIRPDAGSLARAAERAAVITSEMELFFELCPTRIYAITGSDGKTTTTTLTHLFLSEQAKRRNARAFLGGNIGAPLLPSVELMNENDVSVLELSSFQLMGSGCHPHAAAITNVTPNHLNWHPDMEEYVSAKASICGERTKRIVLNADNDITASLDFGEDREYIYFSSRKESYDTIVPEGRNGAKAAFIRDGMIIFSDGCSEDEILELSDIKLPGVHNVENYMTAIALTYGAVDRDIYSDVAKSFGGVEHRLELVATVGGVKYYNSSIDSSPTRTAAALSALSERPIVLCGGSDKNVPFDLLAKVLCERASAVILNGDSAKKIMDALCRCPDYASSGLSVYVKETLAEAIDVAINIAKEGDTVLLSPACASFDQFKNFSERGIFFKNRILQMLTNK